MTDKQPDVLEAMALVIKAEIGRQMDAAPLPGAGCDPKDWTATGGVIDLELVVHAALTTVLDHMEKPSDFMTASGFEAKKHGWTPTHARSIYRAMLSQYRDESLGDNKGDTES